MRRALFLVALVACEDTPRASPAAASSAEASAPAPPPRAEGEGCIRSGSIEGADADPSCVLARASDTAVRDAMKVITIDALLDPDTVFGGTSAILRLTFTNNSSAETMLVLDAMPARDRLPRLDWSRIAGPAEPKVAQSDVPRLLFPLTTLDSSGRNVDATPTLPPQPSSTPPKLLGIRLRPGAKLVHTTQWWAMRIPAPAPIFTDDAGHRFVPKTQPNPLWAGDYTVSVDVPIHGLTPPERLVTAKVHVERAPPKKEK
ncbi:MAG TPA: hypothetical protein VIF62_01045 [Labilithrix sp.]